MEWYLPMTIIPGIGLIILSTSNLMLALNSEINALEMEPKPNIEIIRAKLLQLKRLSVSIVFQYTGVLLFLVAGCLKSIYTEATTVFTSLLVTGVLGVAISIIILLIYSVKAVSIRQRHLKL